MKGDRDTLQPLDLILRCDACDKDFGIFAVATANAMQAMSGDDFVALFSSKLEEVKGEGKKKLNHHLGLHKEFVRVYERWGGVRKENTYYSIPQRKNIFRWRR